jgi:peptidoglycan/LPS O-acetylase OafA/YrhL
MSQRIFGLDLMRAVAIAAVVGGHVCYLLTGLLPRAYKVHMWWAFFGVEVFFVLSGYLVGRLALEGPLERPAPSELGRFWARRWIRTLPSYYLFLLLHFLVTSPEESAQGWRHLFFLQNVTGWRGGALFDASWSLAVEEWFYLLLPLGFLGARGWTRDGKRAAVLTMLGLGGAALLLRQLVVMSATADWDAGIRKSVLFRFDALMAGVALAYLERYRRSVWDRIQRLGALPGAFLLLAAAALFFSFEVSTSPRVQAGLFPVLSLGLFLILPVLAKWKRAEGRVAGSIRSLAKWSYSLYLTHTFFLAAFASWAGDPRALSLKERLFTIGVWVPLSVAAAALLYEYFEKPILKWRDRKFGAPELAPEPRVWNLV